MSDEMRDRLMSTPSVKLATIGLGDLSAVSPARRAIYASLASLEKRREWVRRGLAMRDGAFPIPSVEYLRFALDAFNSAEDRRKTKRWITRRARELNRIHLLPEAWRGPNADEFAADQDQLKMYWIYGEGRGRWNSWTELYRHLSKHLPDEFARRTAAEWFHERYGYWPGDKRND